MIFCYLNKVSKILANSYFHSSDIPEINGEHKVFDSNSKNIEYVIDAGANIGEWSNYVLKKRTSIKKLVMIEPNPLINKELKERFTDHNCVIVIDKALSYNSGETILTFENNKISQGKLYLNKNSKKLNNVNFVETKLTTLDTIIHEHFKTHIDFLKLDLEGFDYYALLGAAKALMNKKIKFIQFEITQTWEDAGTSSVSMFKFLRSFNYNIYYIRPKSLELIESNEIPDFSIYSNFLATYIEI